jgi:energy-coupling factor transporter ATP-binding protein EcfA2
MNQLNPGVTTGSLIGESLGQGLGAGLQALADAKLQHVMQSKQRTQTEQGLIASGMEPGQAKGLALMAQYNPQLAQEAFKYHLKGPQESALASAYAQMVGGQPGAQATQGQPSGGIQQMQQQTPQQAQPYAPGSFQEKAQRLIQGPVSPAKIQQQQQLQGQQQQAQQVATGQPILPSRMNANDFRALSGLQMQNKAMEQRKEQKQEELALKKEALGLRGKEVESKVKAREETLGLNKYKAAEQVKKEAFKSTKEARKEITESAKSAKENEMRLERIKELDKKGNLQNPLLYSVLNKVGLDLPALRSADSQELEKLSNDFLKSAKNVFGARLTNFDVETFFRTVPTLSQTKEGRSRVIRNLQLFNKGALIRDEAMRDILK